MNDTTTARPLTTRDAVVLASIVEAAIHGTRVGWIGPTGDVIDGIARSIGTEHGGFATATDDIRDCYLRVSGTFEHFLPVADVMAQIHDGTFVVGYES